MEDIIPKYGSELGIDEKQYSTFREMGQKLRDFSNNPDPGELKKIEKELVWYKKTLEK